MHKNMDCDNVIIEFVVILIQSGKLVRKKINPNACENENDVAVDEIQLTER